MEDEGPRQQIRFLYKFTPGITMNSFGLCVAQIAGISPDVIAKAELKSKTFSANINGIKDKIRRV